MSSHREAPEISKDPAADNTDVYAFVSPDDASTVTLVANFIPFQNPDGGPNFYAFATEKEVLYEIHIHNTLIDTKGQKPDITYQFRFTETYKTPNTYMYNTAQIGVNPAGAGTDGSNLYPNLNRTQTYTVTRVDKANPGGLLLTPTPLPVPPCNIGAFSTPNYTQYVHPAITKLTSGETVFAGQRADPFFVDLGSVFDLADLRPLQFLHTGPMFPAPGVDSFRGFNVFTIALKVPKAKLTSNGQGVGNSPTDIMAQRSVIGVYASASRQMSTILGNDGTRTYAGGWQQVSRLANPLFNELLIGIGQKDRWNSQPPTNDIDFLDRVTNPDLARKLPQLYPLPFRNLAYYNANHPNGPDRQDLKAILLTGIPTGVIPGFQNFTGTQPADLMRLNMAIPVTARPNPLGVIGGDLQGFPNGRRPADDVADIELKAVAGATLPLTDGPAGGNFVTDIAVNLVSDYAGPDNGGYLPKFPYITTPSSGSATMPRAYAPQ